MSQAASARRGGRVRSSTAHAAVLSAAVKLLEEAGYRAISIEGIAARSGVAKSTIYRWWPGKAELVMEAYTQVVARRVPDPDTGTVEGDLTALLVDIYRVSRSPRRVAALQGMMAEAQLEPAFRESFRRWVQSRQDLVATILTRSISRGELPADLDLSHAIDLLFGPFWYRLLVGHAPLNPKLAGAHGGDQLVAPLVRCVEAAGFRPVFRRRGYILPVRASQVQTRRTLPRKRCVLLRPEFAGYSVHQGHRRPHGKHTLADGTRGTRVGSGRFRMDRRRCAFDQGRCRLRGLS